MIQIIVIIDNLNLNLRCLGLGSGFVVSGVSDGKLPMLNFGVSLRTITALGFV